ncbi:hypothetical protein ACFV06_00920 [Streptomyces sp. NPDC059618]|uniref:hypothetical protein n=1 Tax=Streptomyces sp. NPDC059618 TaxID=3346887 RepID=UPI0036C45F4B
MSLLSIVFSLQLPTAEGRQAILDDARELGVVAADGEGDQGRIGVQAFLVDIGNSPALP